MSVDLCALLREKKLISIVRGASTEKIIKIADALWRGGFQFMEDYVRSGRKHSAGSYWRSRLVWCGRRLLIVCMSARVR